MSDLVFFANPHARDGRSIGRLRRALGRAPALAARSRILSVGSLAEAIAGLRASAPDAIPVAAGGDGTVNMLARALREAGMAGRPLAVLPLGTGNLVAYALGVGSLQRALAALDDGEIRRHDVFVTSHPGAPLAVASLSVGAESRFVHAFDAARRSSLLEAWARAARATLGRSAGRVAFAADGATLVEPGERVFNVGVYNYACYGFGRRVLPHADPRDGAGEAVVYEDRRAWWKTALTGVPDVAGATARGVRWRRWRSAVFETDAPVQVDGEAGPAGGFEIRVEPGSLRLLAPRRT